VFKSETNRIHLVLFGMPNRTFCPCLAAMHGVLIPVMQCGARLPSSKRTGYTRSNLACRTGHFVPVWQPIIGSSFQECVLRLQVAIYRSLLEVACGLEYLHASSILHGDLKAANVLLKAAAPTMNDPRGFTCKIADFGLSRVVEALQTHVSTGTYGTISYMPAEIISGGKLTRAVDIYSFAIISESQIPHGSNFVSHGSNFVSDAHTSWNGGFPIASLCNWYGGHHVPTKLL
jgi:Protein kinase domain